MIGAYLRSANLNSANLVHAIYNVETKFPEGFNPEENDMVFVYYI